MNKGTDRRTLLKGLGLAGAAALGVTPEVEARERRVAPPEALGMLYDTTLCIGCKACVFACKEANDMPAEDRQYGDGLYDAPVDLNERTLNIIKLYRDDDGRRSYSKRQCMHCVDPACAAACMLGSLHKDEVTGVVSYNPDFCVGCRYCQMACPFNVPKFEFSKSAPQIVKCELCSHRDEGPACCEVCPREAVIYGTREELLAEAKKRIAENPGKYFEDRVYGEEDGGGTQVLYLSHLPFESIGLPTLSEQGVPHTTETVQHGLYRGFALPTAMYAALAAVLWRNRRQDEQSEDEEGQS